MIARIDQTRFSFILNKKYCIEEIKYSQMDVEGTDVTFDGRDVVSRLAKL